MLPKWVAEEDRRLLVGVESAAEALGRLRWHWTRDESNPERISLSEYAFQVGVTVQVIHKYAHGYESFSTRADNSRSFTDHLELAAMGYERRVATEAVADARGLTVKTVTNTRRHEVKRVREVARDRAERHGTSVAEEAPLVAERHVRADKAAERAELERSPMLGDYVEMERLLYNAKSPLEKAAELAAKIDWGNDQARVLTETVTTIRELLEKINLAYAADVGVDWDAGLAGLTEEVR